MMIRHIVIDSTDIYLHNYEIGRGKISITDTAWGYNFSHFWGAMGKDTTIEEFLLSINESYFVMKLSNRTQGDFSAKRTFRNVRKYIREEIMPWYENMEFQKDMREELMTWQQECDSDYDFVNGWDSFVKYTLNYYLIDNKFEMDCIESAFTGICEPWGFIENDTPRENIWLGQLFKKLQKELKGGVFEYV